MKITITATLTEEQTNILASIKGYPEQVTVFEDILTPFEEYTDIYGTVVPKGETLVSTPKQVPNPQSKEDYIRQVYEGIISADASREFIAFANKMTESERIAQENAIRDSVTSSITSTVE